MIFESILFLSLSFAETAKKTAPPANEKSAKSVASLHGSISKGLVFSLELQKAEAEKKAAEDDYRLAESKLFPTVAINASGGTQKTSSAYTLGASATSSNISETYKARIDLEQPLFTGGVLTSGLSAAKLNRDVARQKAYSTRQDYIFKIVDAYLKSAQAQVLLSLAQDNRTVLKSYLEITTRYAAIGRSKNIDRLQAEASYNLSEADVLASESTLEQTRQDLVRLLGDALSDGTELETEFSLQPVETGNLDQLLQKAIANNPEIRSLELQVESLKYTNRAKMIDHRPKLSLKGSWGYDSPDRPNWFEKASEAYSLTLNLNILLFSGFSSFAQSDAYAQQLFQLEKDLAIKRLELQKSLAKALSTLQREFHRLKLTQISATSSRKAMDVAVRDYRNGLLSSTDVLNIQRTRFDADRQYTLAQFSYNSQVLSLRRDLGIDLEKAYANHP
jgi:outer membrane protein